VSGDRFSGLDHHGWSHGLKLPVKQAGVKILGLLAVAASDFKVNHWISHVSPLPK
jgi:hypothetical protein